MTPMKPTNRRVHAILVLASIASLVLAFVKFLTADTMYDDLGWGEMLASFCLTSAAKWVRTGKFFD